MNAGKTIIIVALVGAVAMIMIGKNNCSCSLPTTPMSTDIPASPAISVAESADVVVGDAVASIKLPLLLDLGADKCVPCKMMEPVLEELKTQYDRKLTVKFIDVWQNPKEAEAYSVQSIPTQIFFDADGKELFRHIGFISKEDILSKWAELGVEFKK